MSFDDQPTITIRITNATDHDLTLPSNGGQRGGGGWFELVGREEWLYLSHTSAPMSSQYFCDEKVSATEADVLYRKEVRKGETLSVEWRGLRFDNGREISTFDGKKYCVDWEAVPEGAYRARFCAQRTTYPCPPDYRALERECVEVDLTVSREDSTVDAVFEQPQFAKTDSYCDGSVEARFCASRTLDACLVEALAKGCHAIEAQRVDESGTCGASERVGCTSSTDCDSAITHAHDPNGTTWRFANGCVPMGWTIFSAEGSGDLCELNP
jgi:hypothetical protein